VHSPSLKDGQKIEGTVVEGIYKLRTSSKQAWTRIHSNSSPLSLKQLPIGVSLTFAPNEYFYITGFSDGSVNIIYDGIYQVATDHSIAIVVTQESTQQLQSMIISGFIRVIYNTDPTVVYKYAEAYDNTKLYGTDLKVNGITLGTYVPSTSYYLNENGTRVTGKGYAELFLPNYTTAQYTKSDILSVNDAVLQWHLLADIDQTVANLLNYTMLGYLWLWDTEHTACDQSVGKPQIPNGYMACDGTYKSATTYPGLYAFLCKLSSDGQSDPYGEQVLPDNTKMFALPTLDNQIIKTGVYA
jgi:hypothetical protein